MIDKKLLTVPPDVPPRNSMGTTTRANGRLPSHHGFNAELLTKPSDYIENSSCLERTPSGNVYIPVGTLGLAPNFNKSHYQHNSNNSLCNSPTKEKTLPYGTPIAVRTTTSSNNMGTLRITDHPHHHIHHHHQFPPQYSSSTTSSAIPSGFSFRKNVKDNCSWKCTALLSILLSIITVIIISYNLTSAMYERARVCPVLVSDRVENLPAVAEDTFVTVPVLSTLNDQTSSISVKGKLPSFRSRRDVSLHDYTLTTMVSLHDFSGDFNSEGSTTNSDSSTTNTITADLTEITTSESPMTTTSTYYADTTSTNEISSTSAYMSTTDSYYNMVSDTITTSSSTPIVQKNNLPQSYFYEVDQPKRQRIFLNITMETKDVDQNVPLNDILVEQKQPFYVLSLSLPIIDNNDVVVVPKREPSKPILKTTTTATTSDDWRGGCQCFCPCMDKDEYWTNEENEAMLTSTTNMASTGGGFSGSFRSTSRHCYGSKYNCMTNILWLVY